MSQTFTWIKEALEDDNLLEKVDLSSALPTTSLARLKTAPALVTFLKYFSDAKLPLRLGYSQATESVSLTLPLKGYRRQDAFDPLSALIYCMMGLLPDQDEVEKLHKQENGDDVELLANIALLRFMRRTYVAFIRRKMDLKVNRPTFLALCTPLPVRRAHFAVWPTYVDPGQLCSAAEQGWAMVL